MSKMTLEQDTAAIKLAYEAWRLPRMNDIASDHPSVAFAAGYWAAIKDNLAREVTDEEVALADVAQREFFESTPFTGDSELLTHHAMRAALEAFVEGRK